MHSVFDKLGNEFSLEINEDVILSRSDHTKIMNFLYKITNWKKRKQKQNTHTHTHKKNQPKKNHKNSNPFSPVHVPFMHL